MKLLYYAFQWHELHAINITKPMTSLPCTHTPHTTTKTTRGEKREEKDQPWWQYDLEFILVQQYFLWLLHLLFCFPNLQVIKDATQGSESGKTISLYVLDALICIDHERFFLNQLQSRGFLRSCLMNISNISVQVCILSTIKSLSIREKNILIHIKFCHKMLLH